MKKHVRETTTSTDLLIEGGDDHPEGQLLADCSCGESYYVKPIEGLTEFEALERARREHAAFRDRGALFNILAVAKNVERDADGIRRQEPGTLKLESVGQILYNAFTELFDHIEQMEGGHAQAIKDWQRNDEQVLADSAELAKRVELLQAELANVRELAAVNTRLLEVELVTLRRRAAYQGSGVLDPLTRLVMVAEELDADHEYWAVANGEPMSLERGLDEKAKVLREVYGDLKLVLDTVHPNSAYVGDRIRASWEIWDGGTFVEKVTHEGVVVQAKVPGTNFVTFIDEDGVRHGPMVHNYEVIERFKPKAEG